MISLADATNNVRLVAKIIAGVVVVGIIGFFAYRLVVFIIESQKPPEAAEQAFGELPEIQFPDGEEPTNYTYRVNTLDGNLPVLPDRLPVYTTREGEQDLLALQNTRERLENVGFTTGETRLDRNVYQWTRERGEIIKYNILNRNFEIFSSYLFNPPSGTFSADDEDDIVGQVYDFLPQLGVSTDGLAGRSDASLHYFTIEDDRLVESEELQGSQITRVDLFQSPLSTQSFSLNDETVEELPVVYANTGYSTMNFLLEPSRGSGRIVEAHFTRHTINRDNSSDYSIISSEEAWEMLTSGNGHLAQFDPNDTEVDITEVRLGYFMNEDDSGYTLPVIRFLGQNFEAYVDAVDRTPEPTETTE